MRRFAIAAALLAAALPARAEPHDVGPHNVVIFVADGLRYASVAPDVAPTMSRIRREGVDFRNSHAVYPTLTTANASAIATGHFLGDTGDYANVLFTDFPVKALRGDNVPFLENDAVLREMKAHFGDGYLGPELLLCAAAAAGDGAAVVGKTGPAGIQTIDCLGKTIAIDDTTGRAITNEGLDAGALPLDPAIAAGMQAMTGDTKAPPAELPNRKQQAWLASVTDLIVLPALAAKKKPFALVFWSRDPDATQHGQQDSLGSTTPGINGPTARAAIANADATLAAVLDTLKKMGLDKTTDVLVTADHGFSTIAKSIPDARGDLPPPALPQGFLAIDVSRWLNSKIFDPDAGDQQLDLSSGEHPARGNAIIGPSAAAPMAVVAANGGSDLIYTPGPDGRAHARPIFDHLLHAPYVGALFVNDALMKAGNLKDFAGALPMSTIRLIGSASVPQPAIAVGFRSFEAKGCKLGSELCAVEIADTSLQTGQGMHGSPSRADTRNFMAAIGPDFKAGFVDTAPVGNTDIAPTLAHILGLDLTAQHTTSGHLVGRVMTEALVDGAPVSVTRRIDRAMPARGGLMTVLNSQQVGATVYFDAAGIPGRVVGVKDR